MRGPERAGSPEDEPEIDDESDEFEEIDLEAIGVQWCVEGLMVENFHWPADGWRAQLVVCDAPHEREG